MKRILKVVCTDKVKGNITDIYEQQQQGASFLTSYYIPLILRRGIVKALEEGKEVSLYLEIRDEDNSGSVIKGR